MDPTYANAFACLLECFRRRSGKRIVGEKTPIHLLYVPILLSWFPRARVFCLVRDGRDVVESMVAAPFTHGNRLRHAAEWSYEAGLCRRWRATYPDNVTVIRFEDLVRDPTSVLDAMCGKLGLEFEAAQLAAVGESSVVPDWERNWKKDVLHGIDASRVEAWRRREWRTVIDPALQRVMGEELRRWDYDVDPLPPVSAAASAAAAVAGFLGTGRTYRVLRSIEEGAKAALHRIGLVRRI